MKLGLLLFLSKGVKENDQLLTNILIIILLVTIGLLLWLSYLLYRNYQKVRVQNEEINYFYELRKTFIDADNSLIYLKDENLNYVFINKAVEDFYQKKVTDIIGHDDFALTSPEFAMMQRKKDLDVQEKRTTIIDEVRWDKRVYKTTKFPVKLPNGLYGVGAYVTDITEDYHNKLTIEKNLIRNSLLVDVLSNNYHTAEIPYKYVISEVIKLTDSNSGYLYIYDKEILDYVLKASTDDSEIDKNILKEVVVTKKAIITANLLVVPVKIDEELVIIVGLKGKETNYDDNDIYQITVLMNGIWNVKEKENAYKALKENREKLQLLLDSTYEGIYGIDRNGNCTFCNNSCLQILGYNNADELLGKNMHLLIHHSRKDGSPYKIDECRVMSTFHKGEGVHVEDEVYWRKDGTSFDVEYFSYPQYKDGIIVGAVITFMDITERKRVENDILFLSYHDSLTGLYNRRYFEEELVSMDNITNLPISIIMGDVNGLKLTNDIFGHSTGDLLLQRASKVLRKCCREEDVVARWGGDEYIIILPKTSKKEAEEIAKTIKEEFAEENIKAINGSISMGYDTKNLSDEDIFNVIKNAEKMMYDNKILDRQTIDNGTIHAIINTLHQNSPSEKEHSINVSIICEKIGKALKLSDSTIRRLKDAGYFHDIGKIILEERLLNYIDSPTDHEMQIIRQHPIVGYRILNSSEETMELAKYALRHHERWDGRGYPKGLKGNDIPLIARIISIAESYDTMINKKGYDIYCPID